MVTSRLIFVWLVLMHAGCYSMNDSVSLLYYPASYKKDSANGCLKLKFGNVSQPGSTIWPFVRFKLNVPSNQLTKLKEQQTRRPKVKNCALYVTRQIEDIISIPAPICLSPMLVASYLFMHHKTCGNVVKRITYHGSSSFSNDIKTMALGGIGEGSLIVMGAFPLYLAGHIAWAEVMQ